VFDHLGWSELIVLAVVGLIVLGPERLPKAAADAARMLRQLRSMARSATADLKAELGPEMADLDLGSLHPRRLVQSAFWDDEPEDRSTAPAVLQTGERPPYDDDAT
jgi:sec-independent protein translocase protein TatB